MGNPGKLLYKTGNYEIRETCTDWEYIQKTSDTTVFEGEKVIYYGGDYEEQIEHVNEMNDYDEKRLENIRNQSLTGKKRTMIKIPIPITAIICLLVFAYFKTEIDTDISYWWLLVAPLSHLVFNLYYTVSIKIK